MWPAPRIAFNGNRLMRGQDEQFLGRFSRSDSWRWIDRETITISSVSHFFTDTSGISPQLWDKFHSGGFMDILSAIKREERKLEKQLASIQHKLKRIKAAAEAMGRSADKKVTKGAKRVLSAGARAKIGKATKKRWARFRAEAKKMIRSVLKLDGRLGAIPL